MNKKPEATLIKLEALASCPSPAKAVTATIPVLVYIVLSKSTPLVSSTNLSEAGVTVGVVGVVGVLGAVLGESGGKINGLLGVDELDVELVLAGVTVDCNLLDLVAVELASVLVLVEGVFDFRVSEKTKFVPLKAL